jgi:hypothetical protein
MRGLGRLAHHGPSGCGDAVGWLIPPGTKPMHHGGPCAIYVAKLPKIPCAGVRSPSSGACVASKGASLRRRERRFESCRGHVTELQTRNATGQSLIVTARFVLE